MSQNVVKIELQASVDQANAALQKIEKQTSLTNKAWSSFAGNLGAGIALKAVSALGDMVSGTFGAMINGAREAMQANDDLALSLQKSGQYSSEAMQGFSNFADEIERTTAFAGTLVTQNLALLSSTTSLTNDGLQRAQKAAIELAATYNMDLKQATEIVSDAFNGKTKALTKLGIQYTDTGSRAGNFAAILTEIEKNQGTAEAKSKTFEGALAKLGNAWDRVLEIFGLVILNNPTVLSGLDAIASGMQFLAEKTQQGAEWIQKNSDTLELFGVGLAIVATSLVAIAVKSALATVSFGGLSVAATTAWTAITGPVGLTIGALAIVGVAIYALVKYWDTVKSATYSALAATLEFAANGASAIGASSISKSLKEQANEYRVLAETSRLAAEQSKVNEESKTNSLALNSGVRKQILTEEQLLELDNNNKFVLGLAKKNEDIKANQALELEELKLHNENRALIETESDFVNYEAKLQRERDFFALKQEQIDANYQIELEKINRSTVAEAQKNKAQEALQKQYNVTTLANQTELNKKTQENIKAQRKFENEQDEAKLSASSDLFGALAQASALGGKKNFEITKAFMLAEAVTSGILAVQKALASAPPPANFIAAASAGIMTGVNVARISSQQAPAFEQGGIIPGNSWQGDNVIARVNSGEMVLNKSQQANLLNMANSGSGNNTTNQLLSELVSAVRQGSKIIINGKEVFAALREESASGRSF